MKKKSATVSSSSSTSGILPDITHQKPANPKTKRLRKTQNSPKCKKTANIKPKSTPAPCKRSSIYRGVTRHRWTGKFEAHLWDKNTWRNTVQKNKGTRQKKGRQVYLGGFICEEDAARAYDLAALKYWGPETILNFPIEGYVKDMEEMERLPRDEYLASLRRQSNGFSRGSSKFRGVAMHCRKGRWEARLGRVSGNKYLYLGSYKTQEEAAAAFDMAAIEHRRGRAVTNFDVQSYVDRLKEKGVLPNNSSSTSSAEAEAETEVEVQQSPQQPSPLPLEPQWLEETAVSSELQYTQEPLPPCMDACTNMAVLDPPAATEAYEQELLPPCMENCCTNMAVLDPAAAATEAYEQELLPPWMEAFCTNMDILDPEAAAAESYEQELLPPCMEACCSTMAVLDPAVAAATEAYEQELPWNFCSEDQEMAPLSEHDIPMGDDSEFPDWLLNVDDTGWFEENIDFSFFSVEDLPDFEDEVGVFGNMEGNIGNVSLSSSSPSSSSKTPTSMSGNIDSV